MKWYFPSLGLILISNFCKIIINFFGFWTSIFFSIVNKKVIGRGARTPDQLFLVNIQFETSFLGEAVAPKFQGQIFIPRSILRGKADGQVERQEVFCQLNRRIPRQSISQSVSPVEIDKKPLNKLRVRGTEVSKKLSIKQRWTGHPWTDNQSVGDTKTCKLSVRLIDRQAEMNGLADCHTDKLAA